MLHFLERQLEKKVKVAEYLYLNNGQAIEKRVAQELGISMSSIQQYFKEIDQLYQAYRTNGTVYNSQSLLKITDGLVSQSIKMKLLKKIVYYPGQQSSFYKQSLNLSDATFSRLVAQLRMDLSRYEIRLLIKNGYQIEGKEELNIIGFFTHLAFFYKWSLSELREVITKLGGENELKEIDQLSFDSITVVHSKLEDHFLSYFFLVAVIRSYQKNTFFEKDKCYAECVITTLKAWLRESYLESIIKVEEKFDQLLPFSFANHIHPKNYSQVKAILVSTLVQLRLLPFRISISPRIQFFENKFAQVSPEEVATMRSFLYRASRILRADLLKRQDNISFFLITNAEVYQKEFTPSIIQIYSSIGEKHAQYILKKVQPLSAFFDDTLEMTCVSERSELMADGKSVVLTTDLLPELQARRQYLVSDFVSLSEIVRMGIWLKELLLL